MLWSTQLKILQAAARCWREGQKKRCFTYRFLAAGSVEEKIFQRQLSKEGLQSIVDDKEQVNTLSSKDLRNLFKLRDGTPSDTHDKLSCKRCKIMQDNSDETDKMVLPKRLQACKELMGIIMEQEDASHFVAPLDPTMFNVIREKYDQVVKQPIDLGTIMAKLSKSIDSGSTDTAGVYNSIHQFSKDVNRIFTNVMKLWEPGCEIADSCRRLQSWWLEQWTDLVPKLMVMAPDKDNEGDERTGSDEDAKDPNDPQILSSLEENLRGEDYQEQIGMPDEENMRSWSHHFRTDTCDDPIFRAAMRGCDSVSFVFGLEVTWSLIQQRQQEEDEQKAMEVIQQLQACESENCKEEDCVNNDEEDDSESSSDESANEETLDMDPITSNEDDTSIADVEDDESWHLYRILSSNDIQITPCKTDGCNLQACSVWRSNKSEEWSCCLDCQNEDFGSWPEKLKPSEEQLQFIVKYCTNDGTEGASGVGSNIEELEEESHPVDLTLNNKENQPNMGSDPKDTPSKAMKSQTEWLCHMCTFANKSSVRKCVMCTTRKRRSDASSPGTCSVSSKTRLT